MDLDQIWIDQDIAAPLSEAIVDVCRGVFEVISNPPGGANVTEYCKRDACWARVRELDITLPEGLAGDLTPLGRARRRGATGIDTIQPEERDLINEMAAVDPAAWMSLASWAKETANLQPWQRSLAFSLGRLAGQGREPSRKQAVQGRKILDAADRLGFSLDNAA